jgi:hypothetical protein
VLLVVLLVVLATFFLGVRSRLAFGLAFAVPAGVLRLNNAAPCLAQMSAHYTLKLGIGLVGLQVIHVVEEGTPAIVQATFGAWVFFRPLIEWRLHLLFFLAMVGISSLFKPKPKPNVYKLQKADSMGRRTPKMSSK